MPVHQLGAMELDDEGLWLEVECGSYTTDLPYWLDAAARCGGPVVDIGAGVGRVSIPLAQAGHDVIAVDHNADAIATLRARRQELGLSFDIAQQDVRELWLPRPVPLIVVPCSTYQMLGPVPERGRFLERAALWMERTGTLIVALHPDAPPWNGIHDPKHLPAPDVLERDGHRYVSQSVALRRRGAYMELLCDRSIDDGPPARHTDRLWRMTPTMLAAEAAWMGLRMRRSAQLPAGDRYPSTVIELVPTR
jgi:SAM-dependent methyltransferase